MAPPPLWGPPPPLRPGPGSDVGAVAGSCTLPGIGAVPVGDGVGIGDGFGIGAALTGPTPNVSVDRPTPTAIAAALAKRLGSIVIRSLRGYVMFSVLACGYPANAETNPATPRHDVAVGLISGLEGRPSFKRRRKFDRSAWRRSDWCGSRALGQVPRHPAAAPGASPSAAAVPPTLLGWNARRRPTRIRLEGRGDQERTQRGGVEKPCPACHC